MLRALALRLSVSLFSNWAIHRAVATLLEHFSLPVLGHVTEIAAHLFNLWRRFNSLLCFDLNFVLLRAPCVANRLGNLKVDFAFEVLASFCSLCLPRLLLSLAIVCDVFVRDPISDVLLFLKEGLGVEKVEDFTHFDEMLEFDFDFLQESDLVSHVFLFDLCTVHKLINRVVDALDLRVCRSH